MTTNIKYGVLHCHSEHSRKDSVAKIGDLFAKAKEMGAPALALTDHGFLTGVEEAKVASTKTGVKYIPGVEAYYMPSSSVVSQRLHLILMAKDIIGYNAISLAVTASNKNIDSQKFPLMNDEIINEYFGEGSIGHNHVIATSACMNGILAGALRINEVTEKEIEKLQAKENNLYKPNAVYKDKKSRLAEIEVELVNVSEKLSSLASVAKRTFTKKEKTLATIKDKEKYDKFYAEIQQAKKETEEATAEIASLKELRTKLKMEQKQLNDFCKPIDADKVKWESFEEKISVLRNGLYSEEELKQSAIARAQRFVEIFGEGNFYCELQYHGIDEERYCMPTIAMIAKKLGIPVVAANDAHMVDGSPDSVKARQIIRSLRFNKWEKLFPGDKELYIKSDDELSSIISEIFPKSIVEEAMNNIGKIASKCNVEFAPEHHYPKFSSDNDEDATARLRRLTVEGIEWRFPNKEGWTNEYAERMEYELGVITELGFCDYLCIVQDFLEYGRLLGKIDLNDARYLADPYNIDLLREIADGNVGIGIGPGRGSAVGSLVCYLIGITGIDPMKYGLIFERFLNKERVTMPDIDSDFKTDIRDKVIDYVKYKYGPDAVCCIMTKGTQAAKGSVRNCARLLGSEKFDDPKRFIALGDKMCKAIGTDLGVTLEMSEEKIKNEFGDDKYAMEIFHNAKLVEGSFINVGMHAAGVIISDNGDVKQYVPLMYNTDKEQWMTQCEKEPCEENGLLKMDFLGLRNLNVITETLKRVKENTGKSIDIEKIPFDKEVFQKIFAAGNTNSVFQFESGGMKKMLRQFQPETIEDVILLVAAYRPGPMQYLDSIIAVKHGRSKPEYVIPEMESILGKTYGYPVYQEQIMQIFNKFAGFSLGESDIIRRYMSKKKKDKFMVYKDKFIEGLVNSGAKPAKAEDFWNQLLEFSKYAFNKSHATAYAFVAYYTAWLKCKYPKEYLCSVMNDTEMTKINGLIADGKNVGLKYYPANINLSQSEFATTDDGIIVGLGLVKGVASSADPIIENRIKSGEFTSFANFMLRTNCSKDVAENLIFAGAFDKFTKNRNALANAVPEYCEIIKKMKLKENVISETTSIIESKNADTKTKDKETARKERAINAYKLLKQNLMSISVNTETPENLMVRLEKEKEVIGAFVSGHPLDSYGKPSEFGCVAISEVDKGNVSVMGIITNLRVRNRKSDGKPMAFFSLEDQSGSIDINCFTDAYANFCEYIHEDSVVIINGECREEVDNITDEAILKINAKSIKTVAVKKKYIAVPIESAIDWEENVKPTIRPFRTNETEGLELVAYDKMLGKFRKTRVFVSTDILSKNELGCKII